MAVKDGSIQNGAVYAELIIRPMDARPIVISLEALGGDVYVAPGTSHDLVEAEVILSLMRSVVHSLGVVRQMNEALDFQQELLADEGDDLPF